MVLLILIALVGFGWFYFFSSNQVNILQAENAVEVQTLKIVAVGDINCPDLAVTPFQCQQEATAKLAGSLNPDLVFLLGDIQYGGGSLEDYQNFYDKSWGALKANTRPTVGNHEYEEASAAGYFDYFNGEKDLLDVAGTRDKGYYSFEKNGWQFIALNSNCWAVGGCSVDSPQGKWLQEQLVSSAESCQIVYFHHPLFSSGLHGAFPPVKPLLEIMDDNQVEVVLNGHDHLYERFALQDANGNPKPDGIRQFVVGTGGRNLYQIKDLMPNSEIRIDDKFGVLEMELKPQEYTWKFLDTNNQVLDSGSASCHLNQTST